MAGARESVVIHGSPGSGKSTVWHNLLVLWAKDAIEQSAPAIRTELKIRRPVNNIWYHQRLIGSLQSQMEPLGWSTAKSLWLESFRFLFGRQSSETLKIGSSEFEVRDSALVGVSGIGYIRGPHYELMHRPGRSYDFTAVTALDLFFERAVSGERIGPVDNSDPTLRLAYRVVKQVIRRLVRTPYVPRRSPRIQNVEALQRSVVRIANAILRCMLGTPCDGYAATKEAPGDPHSPDHRRIRGPNALPRLSRVTCHAQQMPPFRSTGRTLALV